MRGLSSKHLRKLILGILIPLPLIFHVGACSNGPENTNPITFVDFPSQFGIPTGAPVVQHWIDTDDQQAIRDHAMTVWAALTYPSGETMQGRELPVWETWFAAAQVYDGGTLCSGESGADGASGFHEFEDPQQNFHEGGIQEALTSMVRFNQLYVDNVCANEYNQSSVLTSLNEFFNMEDTPVISRTIHEFAQGTSALKPVFMLVKKNSVTSMPYWAGIENSTDPANPTPSTWNQCVLVDTKGMYPLGSQVTLPCNGVDRSQTVISINDFFFIPLTQADIDAFTATAASELVDAEPGDLAVLVAMHVTTKELPQWTWQTFWWEPNAEFAAFPAEPRNPALVAQLQTPWNNYAMCTAYQMVTPANDPNGVPKICFNPYLETSLTSVVGVESNCMTCHSLATWGNGGAFGGGLDYQANGFIAPDDPIFEGYTKLDFLWSITRAADPTTASGSTSADTVRFLKK